MVALFQKVGYGLFLSFAGAENLWIIIAELVENTGIWAHPLQDNGICTQEMPVLHTLAVMCSRVRQQGCKDKGYDGVVSKETFRCVLFVGPGG